MEACARMAGLCEINYSMGSTGVIIIYLQKVAALMATLSLND